MIFRSLLFISSFNDLFCGFTWTDIHVTPQSQAETESETGGETERQMKRNHKDRGIDENTENIMMMKRKSMQRDTEMDRKIHLSV